MSRYDKGFAGRRDQDQRARRDPEPQSTPRGERAISPIHDQASQPAASRVAAGANRTFPPGPAQANSGQSTRRPARPWTSYTGRFGLICAGIGALGGLLSLVTTGNWAATPVLAVLGGLSGAILFWLLASIADMFRRMR